MAVPNPPAEIDLHGAHPPQIHQYQLVRVLGRGGMGMVYEALHVRLKRRVALKILSPQLAAAPDALERFEREMAAIGQLSHPHIVQALDAGVDNSTHYLAMELVDGENVETLAARSEPLRIADACEIARQAALGLAHAHGFGIVHRDVKPANLLLARTGEVKLADLGLARFTVHHDDEPLTVHGAILGTYDYMSPEQADGSSSGPASDLYSLGATLYRLLAGRPVFCGPDFDTATRKMIGHLQRTPPSLVSLRPEVPADLEQLVLQLLAKQPDQRPKSARDVAERLLPYCGEARLISLGAGASPLDVSEVNTQTFYSGPTKVARAAKPAPRDFRRAAEIAAVCVVCALALAGGLSLMLRSPDARSNFSALTSVPQSKSPSTPQPKAFEDMQPDDVEPMIWYPLLNREPKKIVWPPNAQGFLLHDPGRAQLRLSSPETALVSLGRVDFDSYTLQLDCYQNRWPGSFGILLGLKPTSEQGGYAAQGFLIQTRTALDSDEFPLFLLRTRLVVTPHPQLEYFAEKRDGRAEKLSSPAGQPRMLELDVSRGQLVRVRWGSEELRGLTAPDVNELYAPDDYRGDLGVFLSETEVALSNPRIMIRRK